MSSDVSSDLIDSFAPFLDYRVNYFRVWKKHLSHLSLHRHICRFINKLVISDENGKKVFVILNNNFGLSALSHHRGHHFSSLCRSCGRVMQAT